MGHHRQGHGSPDPPVVGGLYNPCVDYFGFPQGDTADELAEDARHLARAGHSVIYMKVGRGEQKDLENVRGGSGSHRRLASSDSMRTRLGTCARRSYMIRGACARFEPEFIEQPDAGAEPGRTETGA